MPIIEDSDEDFAKHLVRSRVVDDMPRLRFTKLDSRVSGHRRNIGKGWNTEGILFEGFEVGKQPKMYTFQRNGDVRERIGYFQTSALTHISIDKDLNGIVETESGSTYKVERLSDDLFRDRY